MPISKIEFKEFRKMANKKTHIFAYNAVDGLKIASEINSDDIEFFRKASVNDCDFYEILFKHGNKKGSFIFSAEFESWLNPPKEEHKTGKWKCNFPEGTKFEQEIERVKDKVRTKSTETSDIWNFASVLDKLILGKIEKIFKNYKINGLIQNTTNKEVVVEGIKTTVQEKIDVPKAWMTLPTKTVPRPEDSKK